MKNEQASSAAGRGNVLPFQKFLREEVSNVICGYCLTRNPIIEIHEDAFTQKPKDVYRRTFISLKFANVKIANIPK